MALEHYAQGQEQNRLQSGSGLLEFARTIEILQRHLPPAPAPIADVGAGGGPHSIWLAQLGHQVLARDLVLGHVEQLQSEAHDRGLLIEAEVGDARELNVADASVDAVLLLGPLDHLITRPARVQCLREAARVVRPGGIVAAAAISRWAVLLDGVLRLRLGEGDAAFPALLDQAVGSGVLAPLIPGAFGGYCHRPQELRTEVEEAGLTVVSLESVEGAGAYLPDLEERWNVPAARGAVLDVARRCADVPEMLGVGTPPADRKPTRRMNGRSRSSIRCETLSAPLSCRRTRRVAEPHRVRPASTVLHLLLEPTLGAPSASTCALTMLDTIGGILSSLVLVSRSGAKVFGAESLADEVSGQIPQRREQPEEPKGQRWVRGGVVMRVLGMQTTHRSRLNSLGEAGR
jgi:SAM-dependent methyltransferase